MTEMTREPKYSDEHAESTRVAELFIAKLKLSDNDDLADAIRIALAGGSDLSHTQKRIVCEAFLALKSPQSTSIKTDDLRSWIAAAFGEFEPLNDQNRAAVIGQIVVYFSPSEAAS